MTGNVLIELRDTDYCDLLLQEKARGKKNKNKMYTDNVPRCAITI